LTFFNESLFIFTILLDYNLIQDKKGQLYLNMNQHKILGPVIFVILILLASFSYAEAPATPTPATLVLNDFKVFDTPDESTGSISLSWEAVSGENDSLSYVVYVDKDANGKFDCEFCRFPATENWKKDKKWPFWVSGTKEGYHYLEVPILNVFPPPTQPELDSKQNELATIKSKIRNTKKNYKNLMEQKELLQKELDELKKAKEPDFKTIQEKEKALGNNSKKLENIINDPDAKKIVDGIPVPELTAKMRNLAKEVGALEAKVDQEKAGIQDRVYYFKVGTFENDKLTALTAATSGQAKGNWFFWAHLNNFVLAVVFSILVLWFIRHAKKNQNLFLRRINGLDAVEEAVGRATEMGRPVFYQTGIGGMSDISTICATVILGKIAEKVALYDTQIKVPHRDPIVMTVCQEIVKEAYTKVGRPDAYKEDCNFYVTSDQFAYTATVNGMMMRDKPAANFFMGYYMAEALLLSEAGSSTGAIQIAGTDSTDQLPFFITTCDYTLIGEEFYAASAYLSREPILVGTLKAQDVGKFFILAALVIGTIFATIRMPEILDLIKDFS